MTSRSAQFETINLGDIAKVVSGYAFKSGDFGDEGVPVIKIKNIRVGHVDLSDVAYIDPSFLSLPEKYHVNGGDLLISLTGSHLTQPNSVVGRVALHSPALGCCLLNQRAGKIILKNPDLCDSKYLFYVLYTWEKRLEIAQMAAGAASQANVSPSQVESVRLSLPPLKTQRKIASILSTYDDLIENNTRRIKILEEMAQTIYLEWFVNFRFPGYERVKMVDSPLGKIPEGWEVKPIGEMYKTGSGGTPSRKKEEYYGGENPWIKTRELKDGFVLAADEKITELGLKKSSAKLFPEGTVIIAMYGATIGKLGILTQKSATNQACCALLPLKEPFGSAYIYWYLLNNRQELISLGQGAAQQNISQIVIKKFEMLVPEPSIVEYFNQTADVILRKIKNLSLKNENLRQTRGLLLPKLISGAIDVSEIEIKETAA